MSYQREINKIIYGDFEGLFGGAMGLDYFSKIKLDGMTVIN